MSGHLWAVVALLAAAGLLTWAVLRRMEAPRGCSSGGFVFAVLASLMLLSQGGLLMLGSSVKNLLTLPRYQASVIDHRTHISTSRDDDGRTRHTTMYTPLLRFVDAQGATVELFGDMASSEPDVLGHMLTIGHAPGMTKAEMITPAKWGMLIGLTVMLLIMGYVLVGACFYAAGWPTATYLRWGANGLMNGLIPGAMLFMLWGLAYHGVYRHLAGERPDMPAWAFWICVFFSLTLVMALWALWVLKREGRSPRSRDPH